MADTTNPRPLTPLEVKIFAERDSAAGQFTLQKYHEARKEQKRKAHADRYTPIDGDKFAETLLKLCDLEGENEDKKRMFSEIVTRCAYDAAGNINATNEYDKRFNGFNEIFDYFAAQDNKDESSYRKVLNYLPLYKKGIVQTPHPTEMLDSGAIEAEIKLHHAIEERPTLFTKVASGSGSLDFEEQGWLKKRLMDLFTEMKPVTKALKIEDEITRSIEFSELAFDAIPQMMLGVIDPATRSGLRNHTALTADELRHFSRLLDPCTWSPGDRDSKPDMTEARLSWGIERNRNIMSLQYAVNIAEMLNDMETTVKADSPESLKTAVAGLKTAFHKIIAGISPEYLPDQDANNTGSKFLSNYVAKRPVGDNNRREAAARQVRSAANFTDIETPFTSADEMIEAMEGIRKMAVKGVKFPPFIDNSQGAHPILSEMDVLVTQMHCFGNYALRSQIRENGEMHEEVMAEVIKIPEVAAALGATASDRRQAIETLMDILAAHDDQSQSVRDAVQREMEAQKPTKEGERGGNLYETLKGMELAARNPDAIPQYLIAECRDTTDVLEALALLKLVEPNDTSKHVEIVPLVEYREQVSRINDIVLDAYKNKHFQTHQEAISSDSLALKLEKNKLTRTGEPDYERLKVADIKMAYGIEVNDGDETAEIKHTKMVMFAGSDIMKSTGPAGAALTQHAIAELREALLNQKDADGKPNPVLLVDYTGSGGGIHRSQPVSTSYETTQGRSMRQTSNNIAHKSLATISRFVKRMMAIPNKATPTGEDTGHGDPDAPGSIPTDKLRQGVLAQLNLGNSVGFPATDQLWKVETGARCDAAMDSYQELYKSPEFSAMMAFSADKFVKLTSYAARPLARIKGAADTSTFPPVADVEKMRAIGFGAALNVSGSCTSMFFGVSKFMHADAILSGAEDISVLEKLYREDTKTQDVVNRATFGVVMSDLESAWRYLGKERIVEDGKVYLKDREKHLGVVEMASLAENNKAAGEIIERFKRETAKQSEEEPRSVTKERELDWMGALSLEDKRTLAVYSLAKVDMEQQKVGQVLLTLHSRVTGKPAPEVDFKNIQKQILAKLPSPLRLQMEDSLTHITPARRSLAKEFDKAVKTEGHYLRGGVKEIQADAKVFDPIYYRMGACNECFENAPRALSRPWWAIRKETEQSVQTAV